MLNVFDERFVPKRATIFSAGYDLFVDEEVTLCPGVFKTLDTHVMFEAEDATFMYGNWVALVFPRSSYGFKYGLRFANTIGVIDADYNDTIKMSVTVDKEVTLKIGDRYAQMVIVPTMYLPTEIVPTEARDGGIGSTGN